MEKNTKKITIFLEGKSYKRYPIKTHIISSKDVISTVVKKYSQPKLKKKDILIVSERIVAITQGRSFLLKEIHPGFWAKLLYRYVSSHPGGIGLKSPWTMQLAIQEAGIIRILLGGIVSFFTRPLGVHGLFYHIVGHDVNAIDGPCDYTLPPGNNSAKLGPARPEQEAVSLAKELGVGVAIVDANDYGVRIMGASKQVDKKLVALLLRDNPLGQSTEQTPLLIIRQGS